MALISSTSSMIDLMLIRYGEHVRNDTVGRGHCLSWLQQADQELWLLAPWSWREILGSVQWTAGVSVYTVDDAQYTGMLDISNAEGVQLQKFPPRIFNRFYRTTVALNVSGSPTRWGWMPRDSSGTASLKYGVWPVPPDDEVATGLFIKKQVALADSDSNYTWIPVDHRIVLPLKALKSLAIHEGKAGMQQEVEKDLEIAISAMTQKDREHFEGRL